MKIELLLQWFIIGLSIAAPVWPIWVLCIKRNLTKWFASGFTTWLWAATADAFYWAIAGFGLTLISGFLLAYARIIQIIGIIFLGYLWVKTFREKSDLSKEKNVISTKNLFLDYLQTVFLTITNPMTILSFVAIFAGLGLWWVKNDYAWASLVVVWVFLGSASWWLFLSFATSRLKEKIKKENFNIINKISWTIILCFALFLVYKVFLKI